jgi:hypothetical protein
MTKDAESKALADSSTERPQCSVESCENKAFFDGLCHIHGLQRYYSNAKADFEKARVEAGSESRSKDKRR